LLALKPARNHPDPREDTDMSAKKAGKPRTKRSSKLSLKKQTVKDLSPTRGGGRGPKGGAAIAPYQAVTVSCVEGAAKTWEPAKTWGPAKTW
jgi:hypothetical protein